MDRADDARFLRYFTAVAFFGLLCGLSVSQCGCGPSARERAFSASAATVTASASAFQEWDAKHQKEILDSSATWSDYEARIAAYRERQAKVRLVLKAAADLLELADKDPDAVTAEELLAVAAKVKRAVQEITGGGGP